MDKTAYITPRKMEFIHFVLSTNGYDSKQKAWYKSNILIRLNTLQPLVNECINKGLSLDSIDKDLNNEYNELVFLRNKFCL